MPRRKITIAEAMQVLKDNNLNVVVQSEQHREVIAVPSEPTVKPVIRKVGDTGVTVNLFSQHMIGSGGRLTATGEGDEQTVEASKTFIYGPGVCTIPSSIAAQILHQDQLAKQQESKMTDGILRSHLIVRKQGPDGRVATVGVQINNDRMIRSGGDLENAANGIVL